MQIEEQITGTIKAHHGETNRNNREKNGAMDKMSDALTQNGGDITKRIDRLEREIGREGETLEEQFTNFENGKYGQKNLSAIVYHVLSGGDFEDILKRLPGKLAGWFRKKLSESDRKCPII